MKLDKLKTIDKLTPLGKLKKNQIEELQTALNHMNYSVGDVDGLVGSKTYSGLAKFMSDFYADETTELGSDAVVILEQGIAKFDKETSAKPPKTDNLSLKVKLLIKLKEPQPIEELSNEELAELQTALHRLGFPVGDIDGLIGPKTRTAWAEFKTDVFPGNPEMIGPESIQILQEKLDDIGNGKIHDFSSVEGTIDAIKWECKAQGIGLNTQIAYVLATTEWETAKTFKPVREAFWLSENWRKNNLRYYPFYGRGYVQLTWDNNYRKYSSILGVDMLKNPDLAMDENIALFVLVHGFKTGTFTGRKITDYINEFLTDFVGARRCINGTDRANDIANLAKKHLKLL